MLPGGRAGAKMCRLSSLRNTIVEKKLANSIQTLILTSVYFDCCPVIRTYFMTSDSL